MSKEEIITAIRECAQELGRTPSLGELTERVHVSTRTIRRLFGNYGMAVRAAGMEPPRGAPTPLEDLFVDWAGVVRKLEKLPTIFEYERESAYSSKPLVSRFKGWRQVPQAMLAYGERQGPGEWGDVLEIAKTNGEGTGLAYSTSMSAGGPPGTGKLLTDRPVYGPPMMNAGMAFGPANEMGVVYLFGMVLSLPSSGASRNIPTTRNELRGLRFKSLLPKSYFQYSIPNFRLGGRAAFHVDGLS